MRSILLLFLLFALDFSYAQTVTLVNCIDEGKSEYLKLKENLDDNNYLLYSRSFSPDSINFSPSFYWLHKVNTNGNTVWKKQVPNSNRGYYNVYFPNWIGYLTFKVNDFPNKIYTKLDDELIFHYAYYDSIVSDSSGLYLGNDILTFAVMNHSNGTYRSSFINIDTLISNPMDTSVQITNCLVNKINDSIYQMAVQYSKSIYWFWTNIYAYSLTNFYTININSNQVIKQVKKDNYQNSVFSKNNRFYLLSTEYVSYNANNLFLSKINLNGEAVTTVLLTQTPYGGSYIENWQSSRIQLLCNTNFEPNKQNSQLISIDTTTFVSSFTNYSQFIDDAGIINGYESIRFVDYPVFNNSSEYDFSGLYLPNSKYLDFSSFKKTGNTRFLIHSYEYYDSTNTNKSSRFISRLNLENGTIETEKEIKIPPGAYSDELFRDDIFSGNDILVPHDSVTELIYNTDTVFQSIIFQKRLFSLSKLDSNLDTIWTISLPESVVVDSFVYHCGFGQFQGSKNLTYYPVNYHNQFVLGLSYERLLDSTGNNSSTVINYFFINNNTGQIRDMLLPSFLKQRRIAFFNSPNNDLSIITQDSCSGNNLDISIYKYNDIINSVKPMKYDADFDFTIYPNPANNSITLKFGDAIKNKDATVRIIDITGKMVFNTKLVNSNNYALNVSDFSNGIYFIQLQSIDGNITKKLEVIH